MKAISWTEAIDIQQKANVRDNRPVDSQPIAANADPFTSHLAGLEITTSGQRTSEKRRVLEALKLEPLYITSAELAIRTGLDRHLVARRLPDLAEDGLVERCAARNCSVTGRKAITWRAAR